MVLSSPVSFFALVEHALQNVTVSFLNMCIGIACMCPYIPRNFSRWRVIAYELLYLVVRIYLTVETPSVVESTLFFVLAYIGKMVIRKDAWYYNAFKGPARLPCVKSFWPIFCIMGSYINPYLVPWRTLSHFTALSYNFPTLFRTSLEIWDF